MLRSKRITIGITGGIAAYKTVELVRLLVKQNTDVNLIMTDAEELKDGKPVEKYGRIILRGNNVLFIKLENEL